MTTGLIVRYVDEHGGLGAVGELLRRARVPHGHAELLEESRWVSYDARIRLFQAAVEVLEDPRCTFAMGATALRGGLNHSLVLVLRALGSPGQVYRQLPRSVPKFTTTSTMQVIESGATHATLRYHLHEGYVHSRLDCLYAQGLISMIPEIFGLPPAVLVHDECESDGAPACLYHLTWARRSRLARLPLRRRRSRRSPVRDPELVALRGQLQALQSAAVELVGSDDLGVVLGRITERAAAAVLAPSYLLAVHAPQGGPPLVHSSGVDPGQVSVLAARLLNGHDLGSGAVAVQVASSRRVHGVLAAIYAPGQRGPADERPLLAAYAGHAAAALDLLLALDDSRRQQSRSAALLTLAHQLKAATDAETVARVVVASLPQVVGCDASTVLFWEPAAGELRPIASDGLSETEHTALHAVVFQADRTPEVLDMLTLRAPQLIEAGTASPGLRALLHTLHLSSLVVVPLLAGDELLGVATACWRYGQAPADLDEVIERLVGVGEYGATALQNAGC